MFASERESPGLGDVFRATRAAIDQPFGAPVRVPTLSGSAVDEGKAAFAEEFSIVVIANDAAGTHDLWYGTHPRGQDVDQSWSFGASPNGGDLAAVNTGELELDPWLSDDALRLAFSRVVAGQPVRIEETVRASFILPFPAPQIVMSDLMASDSDPFLAFDDTLLVFASNRATLTNDRDIWYATRETATAAFGPPQLVPLASSSSENDPWLGRDGCRLYFTSDATGDDEIYVATMMP